MLEIVVSAGAAREYDGPALVVAIASGEAAFAPTVTELDAALDGLIGTLRESGEFKAEVGDVLVLHSLGHMPTQRVVLVGIGEPQSLTVAGLRRAAANAARAVRKASLASFASVLYGDEALGARVAAQAIVEGTTLGLYRFDRYRESEGTDVSHVTILAGMPERSDVEEGVRRGRAIAEGVTLARSLVNEPPNVLTPSELARRAQELATVHGLECTVLDAAAMRDLGMNALLGVAAGSDEAPAFIILRYRGARPDAAPLGLIGKGITFDSGGISIKPAENMHEMKGDMGGAAAVLGAIQAIAALQPDLPVTALIPTTENLLGGRAQTPGDIVRALNGVTIEIINTDAEGRLILADALSYAVREGLSPLVDVATLTGAAMVALGPLYSAVFGNDDATTAALLDAATEAGEKMWRMPLDPDYDEFMKSDVADIKNQGGRPGGAIKAAIFLKHFVDDRPWLHIDIAPTFWSDDDKGEDTKGGSGVAVRTLVALAERLAGANNQ